jgi:small-conductance mechanosensitive channel
MSLLSDPRLRESLVSLGILLGSYLAARFLSFLFGGMIASAAKRSARSLDDRVLSAARRPVTHALFLIGCYVAAHRSPLPQLWMRRLDAALLIVGVLLITLALTRAWAIFIEWYARRSSTAEAGLLGPHFAPLLSKLGRAVLILLAAITILQQLGVNVASLVVSLGVGSLAVGLAAQETLANLFAGFTLTLDRPFFVGDRIQLTTGEVGDVEIIGMRSTRIRTADETVVIIPNSVLVKDRLVNLSRPTRELVVRIDVNVAYGTELALAKQVLAEAARSTAYAGSGMEPVVIVTQFGESALTLRVVLQARDYSEAHLARSEVLEAIYRRFDELGIEFPFPVRRIIRQEEQA